MTLLSSDWRDAISGKLIWDFGITNNASIDPEIKVTEQEIKKSAEKFMLNCGNPCCNKVSTWTYDFKKSNIQDGWSFIDKSVFE